MEKLCDMERQNVCQSNSSHLTLTLLARSILLIPMFVYVCIFLLRLRRTHLSFPPIKIIKSRIKTKIGLNCRKPCSSIF